MTQAPRPPRLIVGLGNPGSEYAKTRHNAGFWFCERLASELGASLAHESRFHGLTGQVRGQERTENAWLLLPTTFMNRSGQAVAALTRFYRITPGDVLVVHDELDLPPGSLRLKFGGGSGGHNGLKDITAHLGTQDFWRLRIGIGHPGDRDEVVNYVLKPPRREEEEAIAAALDRALAAWPWLGRGDWPAAMQKLNSKPAASEKEGKP
ncbi:MAG TPA: aminoacyl-tRNA hydrolase [Rhodocyclaceae bacterium]|nr:aminoacyl-tRNA hydrolase [Rhodocyclaceae bacterium]